MNDTGANPDDADRAQRHHLPREPQQHRSGDRRKNRQPHLGNTCGSGSGTRIRWHPQHRDRWRQGVSAGEQRAHGRVSARTGEILWDTPLSDVHASVNERRRRHRQQRAAGHHRMRTYATAADGCFISAIDINTGKRAWVPRFRAKARQLRRGNLPKEARAGVETWVAGSDPDLNLTYWGTAQSKPGRSSTAGRRRSTRLYANSTLALNADTGKLAWIAFSARP